MCRVRRVRREHSIIQKVNESKKTGNQYDSTVQILIIITSRTVVEMTTNNGVPKEHSVNDLVKELNEGINE